MWKMVQKYLPPEAQAQQFRELESKGTAHGKHFSLQPLISALDTHVEKLNTEWKHNDKRARDHWQKVVGAAQRLLPAHIVNEYCHPKRAFDPCPGFKEDVLPRSRVCYVLGSSDQWDISDWFTAKYSGGGVGETLPIVPYYWNLSPDCTAACQQRVPQLRRRAWIPAPFRLCITCVSSS